MSMVNSCWTFLAIPLLVATTFAQDEDRELKTITAGGIKLEIPETWIPTKVSSRFRLSQFEIAHADTEADNAELAVFYFGGTTGGIRANIQRWIGQFHARQRTIGLVKGKCRLGDFVLVDIAGTWKKPDGPPFLQKTIDKPGSRVVGVILMTQKDGKEDYYFLKLSGPDALVKSQTEALHRAVGVDNTSVQPFDLN